MRQRIQVAWETGWVVTGRRRDRLQRERCSMYLSHYPSLLLATTLLNRLCALPPEMNTLLYWHGSRTAHAPWPASAPMVGCVLLTHVLVDTCVQERPLPKTVGGIPVDWVEGDIAARQPNLEGKSICIQPSKSVAQSHSRQLQGCVSSEVMFARDGTHAIMCEIGVLA